MDRPKGTAYDEISYPGHPFGETHPTHLGAIGTLFGMSPASPDSCRVLELGCGEGGNLIPMAFESPNSEFVGIDLSADSVAKGQDFVAKLGLRNIELRTLDIMAIDDRFGTFDYIAAHGVYSWVPSAVRARMLEIFGKHLAPHGIAFVSYNCYPGCFMRDIARTIMRYHVRNIIDPAERIRQSRGLMNFLAEAGDEQSIYGFQLREQNERVKEVPDNVLFHDDLSDVATPFFLHEVAGDAGRHGLQYLCDASFALGNLGRVGPRARERLGQIPPSEAVTREQYMDFVEGRSFRQSLFCRDGVALQHDIDANRVQQLYLASSAVHADGPGDPAAEGVATFKTENGSTISTDHRLSRAAIDVLGACWPAARSFPEVVDEALGRLGAAAGPIKANLDEEAEAFAKLVFRLFSAGQLLLRASPTRIAIRVPDKPNASLLARRQAETATAVTNLLHRTVSMKDDTVRQFLMLVDGTRTLDQLVSDLNAAIAAGNPAAAVTKETVQQNLGLLAKLGLLAS
jgi:methyltransferase-like protein/2-polyprenyl-3-methyl-5-hydroxy-6-metoxy-1,4-benzoquinol methylase